MKRLLLAAALGALLLPSLASAFTASGRFLYEDRMWDRDGYTGLTQDLPVRHATVEIVDAAGLLVVGSGTTDEDGHFSVEVTGQAVPFNMFARVLTDGRDAGYELRVVDELVRGLGTPVFIGNIHAVATPVVVAHDPAGDHDFGENVIVDPDGTGVAQAFNIFDNGVDYLQWMAQPDLHGRRPNSDEYVVIAWSPTSANEGSNYSGHAILISSPGQGNDTDGWSDTVILHEIGHWYDDFFTRSDNPGGAHSLGDNNQNPKLSYGEGVATFHCAKVRDWRNRNRVNDLGQPVDDHISIYGDLQIPPPVGTPGSLSFSYDFETGLATIPGIPGLFDLGQRGTANETNVTSAMWDVLDAPDTADESPGIDDDSLAEDDSRAYAVETNFLRNLPSANPVTVEDWYQGWFSEHGASYQLAGMEDIFINLNLMEFYLDAAEPDDQLLDASPISAVAYNVSPAGGVVIHEIDPGPQDAVELYNAGESPVDLTGWQLQAYVNGDDQPVVARIYTFGAFTLRPGEVVAVFERGDPLNDGQYHLYAGTTPNAFNMSWAHGGDGAIVLRDASSSPVDFVSWQAADGTPNGEPVPAGTAFTGALVSPANPPLTLQRDLDGSDSDSAADFVSQAATLASANSTLSVSRTSYATGDEDHFAFTATAGTLYGFEARPRFSASDPVLEVLSPTGVVLGANDDMDPGVAAARLDFFASSSGTYYLRVRNDAEFTDWGAYDLAAFIRPIAAVLAPPSSISADAANQADVGDAVTLRWLNAGAYDAVRLYRDGNLITELPGAPGEYTDHADAGVHSWEVSGVLGGEETSRVGTWEYAGFLDCKTTQDFEGGDAPEWVSESWGVTPFAEGGSWAYTDSPVGTYQGCPTGDGGCANQSIAVLARPIDLPPNSVLKFDHICMTEHCDGTPCDFGVVEMSIDDGDSWTELARYTQASDPAWMDNVADPTDWRPAEIKLNGYEWIEGVLLRFRLQSDALLELDGWYLDNVMVNKEGCEVTSVPDPMANSKLRFLPPSPNPSAAGSAFRFVLPSPQDEVELSLYDLSGRLVRQVPLGATPAGVHHWQWDGKDTRGQVVAAGVYLAKLRAGDVSLSQKVLRLAH